MEDLQSQLGKYYFYFLRFWSQGTKQIKRYFSTFILHIGHQHVVTVLQFWLRYKYKAAAKANKTDLYVTWIGQINIALIQPTFYKILLWLRTSPEVTTPVCKW